MGSGSSTPRSTRSVPAVGNAKQQADKRRPKTEATMRPGDSGTHNGQIKEYISGDTDWNVQQVLHGNPSVKCKDNVKVVRIFTSSTFTDTRFERNALMERVYPQLQDFCQMMGYEFQVVDMRWGVREEALDDHLTVELCMRELELCQRLSTGPNFVTLLSHKYGYRPFPRQIPTEEFELITSDCEPEERAVLEVWFRRDDNAVPAEYLLQPVSSIIPDFLSQDRATKEAAVKKWWETFDVLQHVLVEGAKRVLDEQSLRKYLVSVTEKEIEAGIMDNPNPGSNSLWFKRNINDIEHASKGRVLGRYYDIAKIEGKEESVNEAHKLLDELRNRRIAGRLPRANIVDYSVNWSDHGIDPENVEEHKAYIDKFCADFEMALKNMIRMGIRARQKTEVNDALYNEVVEHFNFCRNKCEKFSGRSSIIQQIHQYILSKSNQPLILHGGSGSGKTSILAVATQNAWSWLNGSCAVVFRFLGTTRGSSSLRPMLFSLTNQISRIYKKNFVEHTTLKELVEEFKESLHYATPSKRLVLVLDSLDQLDTSDGGRHLHWLPRELPPNVKLILSTLPDEQYQAYQSCLGLYRKQTSYIEVPTLEEGDLCGILDKWLDQAQRTLTEQQRDKLLTAFRACPIPLYAKLSFDDALKWHSYDVPSHNQLEETVSKTIHSLLWRIERQHGRLMVSHALGCLTAAQNGLTEAEITDLLSLSDQVLNDVYQFWTPPIRRLPPLLWVRVKNELEEYIVNRGVDGVQVIYWYHRQFIQAANERYLDTADERFRYHLALSEFFLGIWADRAKPYVDKKNIQSQAQRFAAKQPLQFENDEYNVRKLMQLPYHLIQARELTTLKTHALCNYEFLVAKLKATSYGHVMRDLKMARAAFPADQDLQIVTETLQLSQEALMFDGHELASQLVGRIHGTGSASMIDQARAMMEMGVLPPEAVPILSLLEAFEVHHEKRSKHLVKLLEMAHKPVKPTLLPNRGFLVPPGGQLMYQIAGHTDTLTDIDITENGKFVVTGCEDRSAKLWNVSEGEMAQSIELKEKVGYVRFISDDQNLLVSCEKRTVYLVDVQLGFVQREYQGANNQDSNDMCMPITCCLDPQNKEFLITMRNKEIDIWDVEEGKKVMTGPLGVTDWSTTHHGHNMKGRTLLSHNEYFAYALHRGSRYFVLSIDDRKYIKAVKVFDDYQFDKNSEEPDFAPDHVDHISAMAITGDASLIIISNGANHALHIMKFEDGRQLRVIPSKDKSVMANFYLPPDSAWVYFTDGTYVGTWNLQDNEKTYGTQHPCDIRKVVGVEAKTVVTIAEDNIMRIWDRSKVPFEQDMSRFTGKVKLKESKDERAIQAQFDSLLSNVMGDDALQIQTSNLLTDEETLNYWTKPEKKDAQAVKRKNKHLKVISRIFFFENPYYVATVQNDLKDQYSICFSVWDMNFGSCVRRMFLPDQSVYVHMIYNDTTIIVTENRKLKLLDLKRFTVIQVLQGLTFDQRPPFVIYVKETKELITETRGGRYLKVYDALGGEVTGELVPSTTGTAQYLKSTTHPQVSLDGSAVAALYSSGTPTVFLWNLKTRSLIYAINARSVFPGLDVNQHVHFSFTECSKFIVMQKDGASADEPGSKDVCTVSAKTGKPCSYISETKEAGDVSKSQQISLLRRLSRSYIQMISIDKDGKVTSLDYKDAGHNANKMTASKDSSHTVTWCDNPREKTLRYWKFDEQLEFLGSFTPDNELTEVGVTESGEEVILDSSTGIVTLRLLSRDKPAPQAGVPDKSKVLYNGTDVNVPYPEGTDEDLIEDEDDPDKDTDFVHR